MKVVDIANEIYNELDSPSDLSIPPITFWLQSNIGNLNNLLGTSYSLNTTTYEFNEDLNDNVKSIFKKIYYVHYYEKQIRKHLGAASVDTVLEVESDGARVKKLNKNDIAKSFRDLLRDTKATLKEEINSYKQGNSKPRQVAGDDTVSGDLIPKISDFYRLT
jgi:hypothetical protein